MLAAMTDTDNLNIPATVLVTGGSGFLGGHTVAHALGLGHTVRATVRNLDRADAVRDLVRAAYVEPDDRLSFVEADLTTDDGWAAAVSGVDYVLHTASPFPALPPEDEGELIVPARDGTLRVLRAAREAGVKRVVVTSSFGAIGYGHPRSEHVYTESDWSNLDAGLAPYIKSKTVAERAAWDLVESGVGPQLAVINPVGIFGPALGPELSSSLGLILALLSGAMQAGAPRLSFGVVDVRDVAELHLLAMTHPAAAGQRFIASAGDAISLLEAAEILRGRLGERAALVPTSELDDEIVRAAAESNPGLRSEIPELGNRRHLDSGKARRLLGWQPRSTEDALTASAESLIVLGLVS